MQPTLADCQDRRSSPLFLELRLPGGARAEQVRCVLPPAPGAFGALRDAELDAHADALWREHLALHPRAFNAPKFRLHSLRAAPPGRGEALVELRLGLTDYRATLTHHCKDAAFTQRLAARGAATGEGESAGDCDGASAAGGGWQAYLARGMGCETLVVTRDDRIPFIVRSAHVSSHAGMLQAAGSGHFEPQAMGIADDAALCAADPAGVARALFRDARQEVLDEAGIPDDRLGPLTLIGVVADMHKPGFMFTAATDLTFDEVLQRYQRGVKEAFESVRMVAVDAARTADLDTANVTPMTRGALALYRDFRARQQHQQEVGAEEEERGRAATALAAPA